VHDGGQRLPAASLGYRSCGATLLVGLGKSHSALDQITFKLDLVQLCSAKQQEKRETTHMLDLERRAIGKVMRRLIPFLILCYFVAYLDRVNVSFAKLHMNQALGFSEAAFGLGAGLFFIAYFLFEVPSNIFLERVGARVWIARIMISWGIVSAAFAFIPSIAGVTGTSNEVVFYTLRLLLGACEAGFFPGIIFI
jgi:MFS transporter